MAKTGILPHTSHSGSPESLSSEERDSFAPSPCRSCPHASLAFSEGSLSTLSEFEERHRKDQETIAELGGKIQFLQQELFGRKSEKRLLGSPEDLPAETSRTSDPEPPPPASEVKELMDLSDPEERPKRKRGQQPGHKSSGRTCHTDLPAVVEVLRPDLDRCPDCQAPFVLYGSPEEADILEIAVRPYRRTLRRYRSRKTCSCPGTPRISIAPPAPRLVPRGKLGISLWITILTDKFLYNRPTFRLLKDLKDKGLPLAQGTITDGLKSISVLFEPLYERIVEKSRSASFSQADETRFYVHGDTEGEDRRSKKFPHRWWLWVILTIETVVYVVDPSRSAKVPLAHFAQSVGTLIVDRYSSYKYAASRIAGLTLAFCWAHARRDFIKAFVESRRTKPWVTSWIGRIRTLYRLGKRSEDRIKNRAALVDLLALMKREAEKDALSSSLPPPCLKAVKSLLAHWDGLTRFLDRPEIPLDNNASERALRHAVTSRKNFRGAGTPWSASLAAWIYTLFATWSLHGLNIHTALADYLTACAKLGKAPDDLSPWLPWSMDPDRKAFLSRPRPPDTS